MSNQIYTPKARRWKDQRKTSLLRVILVIIAVLGVFYLAGLVKGYLDAISAPTPDIKPVESMEDVKVYNPDIEAVLKSRVSEVWDGERFVPVADFELVKKAEAVTEPIEHESEETRPTGEVEQIIKAAADKYGVSYKLMLKIADCESKLNPKAANKVSTARGLYQFTEGTWAGVPSKKAPGYRKLMGLSNDLDLRFDPVENANTAAYAIANGGLHNWKADPASYNCWKGAL